MKKKRIFGFNDLTCAQVSENTKKAALETAARKGFLE